MLKPRAVPNNDAVSPPLGQRATALCPRCGYDLSSHAPSNEKYLCPECGTSTDIFRVVRELPAATSRRYLFRHLLWTGASAIVIVGVWRLAAALENDAGKSYLLRVSSVPFVLAGALVLLVSPSLTLAKRGNEFPFFADKLRRRTVRGMIAISLVGLALAATIARWAA